MANETKVGVAVFALLVGVFGFVLYRKYDDRLSALAALHGPADGATDGGDGEAAGDPLGDGAADLAAAGGGADDLPDLGEPFDVDPSAEPAEPVELADAGADEDWGDPLAGGLEDAPVSEVLPEPGLTGEGDGAAVAFDWPTEPEANPAPQAVAVAAADDPFGAELDAFDPPAAPVEPPPAAEPAFDEPAAVAWDLSEPAPAEGEFADAAPAAAVELWPTEEPAAVEPAPAAAVAVADEAPAAAFDAAPAEDVAAGLWGGDGIAAAETAPEPAAEDMFPGDAVVLGAAPAENAPEEPMTTADAEPPFPADPAPVAADAAAFAAAPEVAAISSGAAEPVAADGFDFAESVFDPADAVDPVASAESAPLEPAAVAAAEPMWDLPADGPEEFPTDPASTEDPAAGWGFEAPAVAAAEPPPAAPDEQPAAELWGDQTAEPEPIAAADPFLAAPAADPPPIAEPSPFAEPGEPVAVAAAPESAPRAMREWPDLADPPTAPRVAEPPAPESNPALAANSPFAAAASSAADGGANLAAAPAAEPAEPTGLTPAAFAPDAAPRPVRTADGQSPRPFRFSGPDDRKVAEVRPGESYWTVSKRAYGAAKYFKALARFNALRIKNPRNLRPGMKVICPPPSVLMAYDTDLAAVEQAAAEARRRRGGRDVPTGRGYFGTDERGRPVYMVGPGDTLGAIAQKHLGRASRSEQILALNRDKIRDPNRLKPGILLDLPADASGVRRRR